MTRAIIEQVIDKAHVRVRIPEYNDVAGTDNATPVNELSIATVCCLPGSNPSYKVGDIVYVTFERGNIEMPVVVGLLYGATTSYTASDLEGDSLSIKVNCELPQDTCIGNVTSKNISHLANCRNNIQRQIDVIVERINAIIIDTSINEDEIIEEDMQEKE